MQKLALLSLLVLGPCVLMGAISKTDVVTPRRQAIRLVVRGPVGYPQLKRSIQAQDWGRAVPVGDQLSRNYSEALHFNNPVPKPVNIRLSLRTTRARP